MKWRKLPSRRAVGTITLAFLVSSFPGAAQALGAQEQQTPPNTLENSVHALAEHVKQLNATIMELRSEVSRYRQENLEARQELRRVMERLGPVSANALAAEVDAHAAEGADGIDAPMVERLAQVEENHKLLSDKIDEQYQTKVESASRYRTKLSGIVLFNTFANRGRVDNQDVPGLALHRGPLDTGGDFGATLRQSQLGFEVYGPAIAGAATSADLRLDFFGGFPDAANGETAGLVRLRTATVRLDWNRTSVVAGQDAPFFSPLSPTSVASLGVPAFSYSGNLWTWLPQVRVERRVSLSESHSIAFQGGFVDPLVGNSPDEQSYRIPQAGGKSRQPAYGSRISWTYGNSERPLTIGVGGYYSRQNYGAGRTEDAWAGTTDWSIPLGNRVSLSGEFYRGRALGGLGAAQDRSVVFSGPQTDPASSLKGVNSAGGWTQLKFKAAEAVEFNAAYGLDNPFGSDLRYFPRESGRLYVPVWRNQSELFNVIYRPRTDLLFSLEYRRLNTQRISSERNRANHLNLGVGVLF